MNYFINWHNFCYFLSISIDEDDIYVYRWLPRLLPRFPQFEADYVPLARRKVHAIDTGKITDHKIYETCSDKWIPDRVFGFCPHGSKALDEIYNMR